MKKNARDVHSNAPPSTLFPQVQELTAVQADSESVIHEYDSDLVPLIDDVRSRRNPSYVAHALLHNIYRAFDYRDESTIYDILQRSASGDLLTSIYLETRESLTLASQGGARVKVNQVDLISCKARASESDSFVAACDWTVTGSVGHWGHIHQRTNQYRGEFQVKALDGQWKFTAMEVLSEERL